MAAVCRGMRGLTQAVWLLALLAAAGLVEPSHSVSSHAYESSSKAKLQQSCPQALQDGRETCPLWGCKGEGWTAGGLLDDWSFAGYGAGLEAIPSSPVKVDVKRDFRATGNGVTDDTAAVKAAIEATKDTGGVIYFPPGKYIVSDQLFLNSYQVIRGAGRDNTNLRFVKSLADLHGWPQNYTAGHGKSKYTWAGAMITNQQQKGVFAPSVNLHLGHVAKPAKRGDTKLWVGSLVRNTSSADRLFQVGQWITIALAENAQGDLARMLYNNKTSGGYSLRAFAKQFMISHMTRVSAVGKDWIEIERPLHVDISLTHPAVIAKTANYKVTGVGVEDLEVSFPWTAYMGHHEEAGYNAIEFIGGVNNWIRRIRIVNADSGIRLYGSLFNTISDVEITNSPWSRKGGRWVGQESVWKLADQDGHMGIALHWASHDNLVEKFNITGTYYHDLLVAVYSSHNVFSQGRGTDLCLDHHGAAPSNNLWTDIDVGLGQGAMRWSGDAGANPFAGKLNTFWSIWASALPVKVDYVGQLAAARASMQKMQQAARLTLFARPALTQGYQQVVVDMPLDSSMPTIREAGDWLIHYDPDYRVYPSNLHRAMVASAGSRLKLTTNGTFLSDLYPRPATETAWKPAPATHPAVARAVAVRPDPDCLNLGCPGNERESSWARSAGNLPTGLTGQLYNRLLPDSWASTIMPTAPTPMSEAVWNLSASVIQSSTEWLSAAGKAAVSLGSLGIPTNSSSMYVGGAGLSLTPVKAAAADLVNTLKQVVNVANSLLVTLSGVPAQQVPLTGPLATAVRPCVSSASTGTANSASSSKGAAKLTTVSSTGASKSLGKPVLTAANGASSKVVVTVSTSSSSGKAAASGSSSGKPAATGSSTSSNSGGKAVASVVSLPVVAAASTSAQKIKDPVKSSMPAPAVAIVAVIKPQPSAATSTPGAAAAAPRPAAKPAAQALPAPPGLSQMASVAASLDKDPVKTQ